MLHEEFITLTGIEVSHRYYPERIEPEYTNGPECIDKRSFCTAWMKAHKADICKALAPDIDGLIRDAALTDALRAENAERKERTAEAESKVKELEGYLANQEKMIERLSTENNRLQDEINNRIGAFEEFEAAEREIVEREEAHEKALAAKDTEIMKLKAMLFDMMYKTA